MIESVWYNVFNVASWLICESLLRILVENKIWRQSWTSYRFIFLRYFGFGEGLASEKIMAL